MTYTQHPLSSAFPAMAETDFQSLKDSIMEIGVQNPVTIFEGMVIDGWHRYRAANELGMDCPEVHMADVDPRHFVLAQNKARRHITQAQLAMATTLVFSWAPAGNPKLQQRGTECHVGTNAEMAEAAGVSVRSIRQAKKVQKIATPEVQEAVKRGDIGLPKAEAIAKMPANKQAEAITQPLPKEPVPDVVGDDEAPPEYTELDRARDQIDALQSELAIANMGDVPAEERYQAKDLIAELQSEVKSLTAQLRAVTASRDYLMEENSQLKTQCKMNRRELDKLKAAAHA